MNEPRYPKLPDILKAKKKEIKCIDISTLGISDYPSFRLKRLEATKERSKAIILEGDTKEVVSSLVEILRVKERVI